MARKLSHFCKMAHG